MRTRQLIFCIALVTAAAGIIVACKPDATKRARASEKWLTEFYTHYAIRGGWGFFGAESKGMNVRIIVNMPQKQALELAALDPDEQVRIVRVAACPPWDKDVWSMLDEEGDVIIETRNKGNTVAIVPCRTNPKGSNQ